MASEYTTNAIDHEISIMLTLTLWRVTTTQFNAIRLLMLTLWPHACSLAGLPPPTVRSSELFYSLSKSLLLIPQVNPSIYIGAFRRAAAGRGLTAAALR